MRRRPAVALAGALLATVAALSGCGDDGETQSERVAAERAEQVRELARDAGLSAEVGDFLATAAAVPAATYRVSYEADDEAVVELVVTQLPPDRRIDITAEERDTTVSRSLFATDEGSYTCRKGSTSESAIGGTDKPVWFCATATEEPATPGAFLEGDLARTVTALRDATEHYDFRVTRRTLLGVRATCLVTELKEGAEADPALGPDGTLCVSPEGVPLLVDRPAGSLTASRYRTDVDPKQLELPADPEPLADEPIATSTTAAP